MVIIDMLMMAAMWFILTLTITIVVSFTVSTFVSIVDWLIKKYHQLKK